MNIYDAVGTIAIAGAAVLMMGYVTKCAAVVNFEPESVQMMAKCDDILSFSDVDEDDPDIQKSIFDCHTRIVGRTQVKPSNINPENF